MVLHWKDFRLSKGGSKSGGGGGGGGAATTPESPPQHSAPTLPNGVQMAELAGGTFREYHFKVGDNRVDFSLSSSSGSTYVAFQVNRDFDRVGGISARQGAAIFGKLKKIMDYDASTRPDGFKYKTSAWTGDGADAMRVRAYRKAGFTRPVGGYAGGDQYAVVKNGRLVPDRARLKAEDRDLENHPRDILRNMRRLRESLKTERQERRGG